MLSSDEPSLGLVAVDVDVVGLVLVGGGSGEHVESPATTMSNERSISADRSVGDDDDNGDTVAVATLLTLVPALSSLVFRLLLLLLMLPLRGVVVAVVLLIGCAFLLVAAERADDCGAEELTASFLLIVVVVVVVVADAVVDCVGVEVRVELSGSEFLRISMSDLDELLLLLLLLLALLVAREVVGKSVPLPLLPVDDSLRIFSLIELDTFMGLELVDDDDVGGVAVLARKRLPLTKLLLVVFTFDDADDDDEEDTGFSFTLLFVFDSDILPSRFATTQNKFMRIFVCERKT